MAMKDVLLPEFDQEMATTRKLLAVMPEEDAPWKPHPRSFSLGDLTIHIANMIGWTTPTLKATEFNMNPHGGAPWVPPTWQSKSAMLEAFDARVAEAREAIASTSDADFMVPWSLKSGDQTLMTLPRVAVLRTFVLSHVIHHRGQLSVYLRLRDVPVPSIYGQSADAKGEVRGEK
jgi:uncharacterized damage-inducible protein DinB